MERRCIVDESREEKANPQFKAGWNAYHQGTPYHKNPNAFDTREFNAWSQGWDEALSAEITDNQNGGSYA